MTRQNYKKNSNFLRIFRIKIHAYSVTDPFFLQLNLLTLTFLFCFLSYFFFLIFRWTYWGHANKHIHFHTFIKCPLFVGRSNITQRSRRYVGHHGRLFFSEFFALEEYEFNTRTCWLIKNTYAAGAIRLDSSTVIHGHGHYCKRVFCEKRIIEYLWKEKNIFKTKN